MPTLRTLIDGNDVVVAPGAFNGLMAMLAKAAGFRALYLSGGSLGWLKGVTEATIALPDMTDAAVEIRTVCDLPLILDAAGGFGDPVHMHRTITMAEAVGFAGIEIEDQVLPKRMGHHVGEDRTIPQEMMVAKLEEAVAARTNRDFVIIARTDASRSHGLDEALRRGEAYRRAGADVIFVAYTTKAETFRAIGRHLGGPLMAFAPHGGLDALPIPMPELVTIGYRLLAAPQIPLLVLHKAMRQFYTSYARGGPDPLVGADSAAEYTAVQETVGLPRLLDIERRTMGGH
jgi:2-methylisocitrate lyase-like PEP mutase family enzyme